MSDSERIERLTSAVMHLVQAVLAVRALALSTREEPTFHKSLFDSVDEISKTLESLRPLIDELEANAES